MDYLSFCKDIRGKIKKGQKCTMQVLKAGYPKEKLVRGAEVITHLDYYFYLSTNHLSAMPT